MLAPYSLERRSSGANDHPAGGRLSEYDAGVSPAEVVAGARRLLAETRGRQLAEARKHAELTQKDLAAGMGVSIARISQIEHGEVTSIEQLAEVDGDPPCQSRR